MFGISTRPQTEDIRGKMAQTAAEIAALEADLPRISLEAINSDDDSAAKEAIKRLADLRTKQEVLSQGLVAAEQAETEAQEAIRARELLARKRSASQQCGRLERAAMNVSQAAAALVAAFGDLTNSAASLLATLPDRSRASGWDHLLGVATLRDALLLEIRMQERDARPKIFQEKLFDYENKQSLSDRIASLTASARASFDRSPTPAPELIEKGKPAEDGSSPSPSAPTAGIAPSDEPRPIGDYAIDLRGRDLGVEKRFTDMEVSDA